MLVATSSATVTVTAIHAPLPPSHTPTPANLVEAGPDSFWLLQVIVEGAKAEFITKLAGPYTVALCVN
jgi:hypothetical protein